MESAVESVGYRLSREQFERFRALVHERSGIALRAEKQQLLCSRLAKRLRALNMTSFDRYYELLTTGRDAQELEAFLNAVTTNKTSFFREAHHFQELRKRVVPPLLRSAQGRLRVRVWSAGCSSGEEPYSIVMTLLAAIPRWEHADVRVLASDLDSQVLAQGERGAYPSERVADLPDKLVKQWFIRGTGNKAGHVRVRRCLRERVAFRRINFVAPSWPVRTQFDAIFCRNALIYFDAMTQQQVVSRLLSHLAPGGLLFLGHSESMAGVRPDLRSLGRTTYLYLGATP